MANKQIKKSAKKLFSITKLCYSVYEANNWFASSITLIHSVRTNRQNIFANQSFNIEGGRINPSSQELFANMYSNSEVDLIYMLSIGLGNDYVRGNHFSEVIHDDSCENLLENVFPLL